MREILSSHVNAGRTCLTRKDSFGARSATSQLLKRANAMGPNAGTCSTAITASRLAQLSVPAGHERPDLAVLCPLCHRALHRIFPMPTVEQMRQQVSRLHGKSSGLA